MSRGKYCPYESIHTRSKSAMDVKINIMSILIYTYKFKICNRCQDEYNVKMCNRCQDKNNDTMNQYIQDLNLQWMSR